MKSNELKQVDVRLKLVEGNGVYSDKPITNPQEAISVMADVMAGLDREEVCVINLDSKGHPINFNVVSIGTLNSSFVSGRELFKSAILSNAASMILLHNHPSSELQMSQSDRMVTEKMMYASLFLDIEILDHIIVAGRTGDTLSIRETYPEIFDKSTYANAIVRVADGVEERENSYNAKIIFMEKIENIILSPCSGIFKQNVQIRVCFFCSPASASIYHHFPNLNRQARFPDFHLNISPNLFFYTFCGHPLDRSKILLCLIPEPTYRLFCFFRVIFFLFQKICHFRKPKGIHIVSRFFSFFFNHNHITDRHGMPGKIIRMIQVEFFI